MLALDTHLRQGTGDEGLAISSTIPLHSMRLLPQG